MYTKTPVIFVTMTFGNESTKSIIHRHDSRFKHCLFYKYTDIRNGIV